GAGGGLARIAIVDDRFGERLADALDGAALDLAFDEQRVDHAPDVVHRRVGRDFDRAGLGIDLDLADVTAVGPRCVGDLAGRGDDDATVALASREVEEADATVGAGDNVFAIGVFEVSARGLQRLRREVARCGHGPLGADTHGRPADEQRARSGAAEPGRAIGVSLDDPDLLDRYAEDIDTELGGR